MITAEACSQVGSTLSQLQQLSLRYAVESPYDEHLLRALRNLADQMPDCTMDYDVWEDSERYDLAVYLDYLL